MDHTKTFFVVIVVKRSLAYGGILRILDSKVVAFQKVTLDLNNQFTNNLIAFEKDVMMIKYLIRLVWCVVSAIRHYLQHGASWCMHCTTVREGLSASGTFTPFTSELSLEHTRVQFPFNKPKTMSFECLNWENASSNGFSICLECSKNVFKRQIFINLLSSLTTLSKNIIKQSLLDQIKQKRMASKQALKWSHQVNISASTARNHS